MSQNAAECSLSSSIFTLMRPEKSCRERFWKQSRGPRGLGYETEARRWKILLVFQISSSKSASMDTPEELLFLFFGGLIAETYCGSLARTPRSVVSEMPPCRTNTF